jgi:2'-5' RNA ligase
LECLFFACIPALRLENQFSHGLLEYVSTVAGAPQLSTDKPMRLFVALDIDSEIRARITRFRDELRAFAPDVKWVKPETFHITLQFLGETRKLEEIKSALSNVEASSVHLAIRGVGFFPNPKSARVFWIGIEADEALQNLASGIGETLAPLGFERDSGQFRPHLTLARAGGGRPRPVRTERAAPGLQQVRAKIEAMQPFEFGTMTASEFYLYQSKLSPAGPHYTKLARYQLR